MFHKRTEPEEPRLEPAAPPSMSSSPASRQQAREQATIGPSIRIRGDLSGEEDLVVQGHVEGTISLQKNVVRVGKDGHVSATVHARIIDVEGRVEGDMHGDEQVILHRSANVQGNIVAPRVTLEDGCRFKGSIDMDVAGEQGAKSRNVTDLKAAKPGETGAARGAGTETARG